LQSSLSVVLVINYQSTYSLSRCVLRPPRGRSGHLIAHFSCRKSIIYVAAVTVQPGRYLQQCAEPHKGSLKKLTKTRKSASHIFRVRSPSDPLGLPSPREVLRGLRSSNPSHPDIWSIAMHEEITKASYSKWPDDRCPCCSCTVECFV
jgi:hypothetical protein